MKKNHSCRELFNAFTGKEVWISGSDPSLSDYPDDFFDNKTAITLHLSHLKFPNATFRYSSEFDRSLYLLGKDPLYKEKPLIAALPMYGKTIKQTKALLQDSKEVYFHRMLSYPPYGLRGKISESYTRQKILQTMNNRAHIWGGHGSCLHTCMYMAVLLGASSIHLIGCGHNLYSKDGLEHYQMVEEDHHTMRPNYRSFSDPVENVALIEQTSLFGRLCEENGIKFYWHKQWCANMDSFITYSDEWFLEQKKKAERKFPLIKTLYRLLIKGPIYNIITRF